MSGIVEFRLVRPQPGMEASFDLMLDSAFTDADALRAYATHPAHQEVGAYIAKVRTGNPAFVHFEVRQGFDSVDPMKYLQ